MNTNITSTLTPKKSFGENTSWIFSPLLIYISILLTLKTLILIYWFFVECKFGKELAEKIVNQEFASVENISPNGGITLDSVNNTFTRIGNGTI